MLLILSLTLPDGIVLDGGDTCLLDGITGSLSLCSLLLRLLEVELELLLSAACSIVGGLRA